MHSRWQHWQGIELVSPSYVSSKSGWPTLNTEWTSKLKNAEFPPRCRYAHSFGALSWNSACWHQPFIPCIISIVLFYAFILNFEKSSSSLLNLNCYHLLLCKQLFACSFSGMWSAIHFRDCSTKRKFKKTCFHLVTCRPVAPAGI